MPTNVQVRFEDGSEPVTDLRVHRLEYIDGSVGHDEPVVGGSRS